MYCQLFTVKYIQSKFRILAKSSAAIGGITQQILLGDIWKYDEPNGLFECFLDDECFLPFEGTVHYQAGD